MQTTVCTICKSPYRKDIEKALKAGIRHQDIALNFYPLFKEQGLFASIDSFRSTLTNHIKRKHPPLLSDIGISVSEEYKKKYQAPEVPVLNIPTPEPVQSVQATEPTVPPEKQTIDDYLDAIMQRAFSPEMMAKLTPAQIIQAQKLVMERDKTKQQNVQLMEIMNSFMSGLITEEDEEKLKEIKDAIKLESNVLI